MPRILFVDDDAVQLELLCRYLKRQGYVVESSDTAEDALKVFEADPDGIGLLISDLTLAGITGEELLEKMREKRPALPGILLSGYPYDPQLKGARFLQKPFMPHVLTAEIDRLLKH